MFIDDDTLDCFHLGRRADRRRHRRRVRASPLLSRGRARSYASVNHREARRSLRDTCVVDASRDTFFFSSIFLVPRYSSFHSHVAVDRERGITIVINYCNVS